MIHVSNYGEIVVNDTMPLTSIIKKQNNKKYLQINIRSGLLNCRAEPNSISNIKGRFNNNKYLTNLSKIKKNNKIWYKVKGVSEKGTTIIGYCLGDYLKSV